MLHFLHTKNFVLQNADPIIHLLKNTNEKSVPNLLQHMTFQRYKLESKLPSNVDFAFKGGKTKGRFGFSKVSLNTVVIHLIENCYSAVENVTMKQLISIPMG